MTSPKPAEKAKEEVVKVEEAQNKNWAIISVTVLALVLLLIFSLGGNDKADIVEGCEEGDKFSQTTGEPCQNEEAIVVNEEDAQAMDAEDTTEVVDKSEAEETEEANEATVDGCLEGEKYDRNTGELCEGEVAAPAAAAVLATTGALSYEAAIKQYAGKSVVVGADCAPNAAALEVAVGTRVLVANNSTKAQELSIQDRKVNLRPYHYMTSSVKVAGEFPVTCAGETVATVTAK